MRTAVLAAALLVAAGSVARAQVFDGGLGIAPSLPDFIVPGNPAAGLLSGLLGSGSGGVVLTQPAAIASSLLRARCVALVNQVAGASGSGSIRQSVEVQRFVMNC